MNPKGEAGDDLPKAGQKSPKVCGDDLSHDQNSPTQVRSLNVGQIEETQSLKKVIHGKDADVSFDSGYLSAL